LGDFLNVRDVCQRRELLYVYPTLLAAISDVAHPQWRATTMGVYRFWRDLGYAIGALISGIIADPLGMRAAIQVVAALSLLSGLHVAIRTCETLIRRPATGLGGGYGSGRVGDHLTERN
jgi:MFS family permease